MRGKAAALHFLAGGRKRDLQAALRADALGEMLTRSAGGQLWQVRDAGPCLAVAMVIPSAGRVGVSFHSPAEAPGVDADALRQVLSAAAEAALTGGVTFVQSLIGPDQDRDANALQGAGYVRLAGLLYMMRGLSGPIAPSDAAGELAFDNGRRFDLSELGRVILGTYEGSLDCPPLAGFRRIEDVIASHKASGRWRPDWWWIVRVAGEPAGCVLVNESTTHPNSADLVYMGLSPRYRGRGIGRAMVRHVCAEARRGQCEAMFVVVDQANPHAQRIYEAEGFGPTHSRVAYIRR